MNLPIIEKEKFDRIIEELQRNLDEYNNNPKYRSAYNFLLANGEKISFSIKPKNVAHLLGIKTLNLESFGFIKEDNSIEIMQQLISRKNNFYQLISTGLLHLNSVFSKYIFEKLEIFLKNIDFTENLNEIDFVCCYDKDRAYLSGETAAYPADYYIGKKTAEGDMILLGLVKSDTNTTPPSQISLIPQSSIIIPNDENQEERLKQLLHNQIITNVATVDIWNPILNTSKRNFLNRSDSTKHLETLYSYQRKYGAICETTLDHICCSKKFQTTATNEHTNTIIMHELNQAIETRTPFDIEASPYVSQIKFNPELFTLIQKTNHLILVAPNYHSTQTQPFEQKILSLEEQIQQLQAENQRLKDQINVAQEQKQQVKELLLNAYTVLNNNEYHPEIEHTPTQKR